MKWLIALALLWPLAAQAQVTEPTAMEPQTATAIGDKIVPPTEVKGTKSCPSKKSNVRFRMSDIVSPTGLSFEIAADGSVQHIVIKQSSGVPFLDEMAAECASHWRYTPATKDSVPIAVPWETHINWNRR
ncbi:MAG TPA: energy transducer TonB [Rhizomicrobium sp.]|nr:energy transducer TonB [Rhizomicrobium sp.]